MYEIETEKTLMAVTSERWQNRRSCIFLFPTNTPSQQQFTGKAFVINPETNGKALVLQESIKPDQFKGNTEA